MSQIDELNAQFGTPGVVTIDAGNGGLPRIRITSPAADAEIYLHGAHVTRFQPKGQKPVLFMSAESLFDPTKAIRGGVPLIFPWFGPSSADPKLPAHGFARTNAWTLKDAHVGADAKVTIALTLGPSDRSRLLWPHDFGATFTVGVGKSLDMSLEIVNRSNSEITYEEAFHAYLVVGDIRQVKIEGLKARDFIDKVDGAKRKTEGPEPITITGETDRVYLDTPDLVTVDDAGNSRKLVVSKTGSQSTVVWNPWIAKSKAMADFGDDEWPGMLCVESANAAENVVKLAPGARHVMSATIEVA